MPKVKATAVMTTDQALALAMQALEKIKKGEGTPMVVAVTALSSIPAPEEMLSVKAVVAPLIKVKTSWDASARERHEYLRRLTCGRSK